MLGLDQFGGARLVRDARLIKFCYSNTIFLVVLAASSPAVAAESRLALTTFLGRQTQIAIPSTPEVEPVSATALGLGVDYVFRSLPSFSIGGLYSYATSKEFDTRYGAQHSALILPGFYLSLGNILIRADVGLGLTWGYLDSDIPNSPLFSLGTSLLFPLHPQWYVGATVRLSHPEGYRIYGSENASNPSKLVDVSYGLAIAFTPFNKPPPEPDRDIDKEKSP